MRKTSTVWFFTLVLKHRSGRLATIAAIVSTGLKTVSVFALCGAFRAWSSTDTDSGKKYTADYFFKHCAVFFGGYFA